MSRLSAVMQEDINSILLDNAIPWTELDGKTVVVSGATGLIGKTLVYALLAYGEKVVTPPHIVALVRNEAKAKSIFSDLLRSSGALSIVKWEAGDGLKLDGSVDYIIHAASQTSSKGFVEQPVETIATSYYGTASLLELAKEKSARGFVYLSTMEIYGTPSTDEKITEEYIGLIDPIKVRNCYPESKKLCENLCVAYCAEYSVPTTILRLTQTFGPGVSRDDNRVFAQFARCAISKTDIVLHTKGETKRNYVYTADAVRAILLVLLRGAPAAAYNVANENTYCSIYDMATMVAEEIAEGKINVQIDLAQDAETMGYAPVLCMNLDTAKLRSLGWRPHIDLREMYRRLISGFTEE